MVSVVIEPYEPLVYKAMQKIEELEPQYFQGIKRIVLEQGDPGHFGQVRSDEKNTIYVSVNKIRGLLSGRHEDEIVQQIAEVLAHEMGHIKDDLKGGEGPAEAEEAAMRQRLQERAAYYQRSLIKTANIPSASTPQDLATSILRIIYHFGQKVDPENRKQYFHHVEDRMRELIPQEIAGQDRNPGGGIGSSVSMMKNILAGQPADTIAIVLSLVAEGLERL